MKQFTVIVETIILETGAPSFLVRDPRSGNVARVFSTYDELSEFFGDAVYKLQNDTPNE